MNEFSVDVDECAQKIRKLFLTNRLGLYPGSAKVGKSADKIFEKAARLCLASKETPETFVRKRLEVATLKFAAWPQCLLVDLPKESEKEKLNVIRTQAGTYKSQLVVYTALCRIIDPTLVLEDTASPFTPLFRYAMSVAIKHLDYAAAIADSAKVELGARPFAKEVFGDLLKDLYV